MLDLTLTSASSMISSGVRQPGSGDDDIDIVGERLMAATLPSFIGNRVTFSTDDVSEVLVCDDGDFDTLRPEVRVRETDRRDGAVAGFRCCSATTSRATELLREFDADGVFPFKGGRPSRLSVDFGGIVIGFGFVIIVSSPDTDSGLISRNA